MYMYTYMYIGRDSRELKCICFVEDYSNSSRRFIHYRVKLLQFLTLVATLLYVKLNVGLRSKKILHGLNSCYIYILEIGGSK